MKAMLASAGVVAAVLGSLLLAPSSASAEPVFCDETRNPVKVHWHNTFRQNHFACFANPGENWFAGDTGYSSYMDRLETGQWDVTFVDCDGTRIDYSKYWDISFSTPRCIAWINIK